MRSPEAIFVHTPTPEANRADIAHGGNLSTKDFFDRINRGVRDSSISAVLTGGQYIAILTGGQYIAILTGVNTWLYSGHDLDENIARISRKTWKKVAGKQCRKTQKNAEKMPKMPVGQKNTGL